MNLQEYIRQKKELYNSLLSFIEDENADGETYFRTLNENIQTNLNIFREDQNNEELKSILHLVVMISNNHHRTTIFDQKIEQILLYFRTNISQIFSNTEAYHFFKNNRRILLFLIQNEMITVNNEILDLILNDTPQRHFFYPEIRSQLSENNKKIIEDELLTYDRDIFNNFEEKRSKYENDSHICQLIRQDSIEEFIIYVNQLNYPLTSTINLSLFETNSYLMYNTEMTLIEYAAFFGSIRIFQYLILNNIELKPSLWLYVIHSNNPELISILETNQISPPNDSYEEILIESIKCHHNSVSNYIINNFLSDTIDQIDGQFNFNENISESIFHFYNFEFFPINFKLNHSFYYLHRYYYNKIVNLYLNEIRNEINERIVFKYFFLIIRF